MDAMRVTGDSEPTLGRPVAVLARQVEAAMGGDEAAFEALVTARVARAYRMALAILGSEADARDAVQDAWVAAWRQLPTLLDVSRFTSWLDQIVVNACRMTLRKRRRVREIALADDVDIASHHPGPEQVAEREALDRAFGRLTIDQRSILVLHHLERQPLSVIAETLGIPVGTAKSRLHTARSTLERLLAEER
jgi:RNA polymerase sigma-70 factor (ECF subfamily)